MAGNGGGNSGGGKSGGDNLLVTPQLNGEVHPRGLLAAIGYIETSFANEMGGCLINPDLLTTPQRIEFMEVGARSSFASGLVMALLTPLAIGVLDRYVPIFGSFNPNHFDQLCGIMLALVFPLCYAFLFAGAAVKHLGGYSRGMVNNLLGGMAGASFAKAIIAFLAFHFIYFKILSDDHILFVAKKLLMFKIPYNSAVAFYLWVKDFKQVFITSAYFVLVSTLIFILVPYIAFLWAHLRNKKLIAAGVVDVYEKNI